MPLVYLPSIAIPCEWHCPSRHGIFQHDVQLFGCLQSRSNADHRHLLPTMVTTHLQLILGLLSQSESLLLQSTLPYTLFAVLSFEPCAYFWRRWVWLCGVRGVILTHERCLHLITVVRLFCEIQNDVVFVSSRQEHCL